MKKKKQTQKYIWYRSNASNTCNNKKIEIERTEKKLNATKKTKNKKSIWATAKWEEEKKEEEGKVVQNASTAQRNNKSSKQYSNILRLDIELGPS